MKHLLTAITILIAVSATAQKTADTAITTQAFIALLTKFKDSSDFNKLPAYIKAWHYDGGYEPNGVFKWVVPKELIEASKRLEVSKRGGKQ
jgi:hypothetical protein